MYGPRHYRRGEEWLARAHRAYDQIADRPSAQTEAVTAAAIAQAHFLAAQAANNSRSSDQWDWQMVAGQNSE
ncbi:hypothetical protein [Nocardiopsis alba]|uniref:hypothetical protein n=1 Tax=Nocardiopsis alba TaxID=53437 RepID=UPI0033A71AA8